MGKDISLEKKTGTLHGFRIRTLSLWIVVGTLLVSVLIGDGIINVMNRHRELAGMTSEYIQAQNNAKNMLQGSDYLTEQVRLYAMTMDYTYADNYFTEVNETERRDISLEELKSHLRGKDDEALKLSGEAMKLSNELMDLEYHSMKLTALAADEELSKFPAEVQDYLLTEEEILYTPQEKSDAARGLLFGSEYRNMKQQIGEKLSEVTESVIFICEKEQAESETAMKNALIRQSIYTVLVVVLVILAYIMIAVLILRPIRIYINNIKNNNLLEITGAYEFKYLAAIYNDVYEMSQEQHNMLKKKAERDALTGLLNRQAFEHLKEQLQGTTKPIAFLLLDVDVFKSINDTYGHEMGDRALIRVANLLADHFRQGDFVFRIGGDEFAVVMEKMHPEKKEIISEKIEMINRILQHPEKNFPKYSLSVGVAFSDKGYDDELFREADRALYHTKENGRCGYTFYDAGIETE